MQKERETKEYDEKDIRLAEKKWLDSTSKMLSFNAQNTASKCERKSRPSPTERKRLKINETRWGNNL